jgi:hypothetical protein
MVFVGSEGDILGTVGVFLSGAGSILTALGAIHYERRRGEKDCQRRFDAYLEGMKMRGDIDKEQRDAV